MSSRDRRWAHAPSPTREHVHVTTILTARVAAGAALTAAIATGCSANVPVDTSTGHGSSQQPTALPFDDADTAFVQTMLRQHEEAAQMSQIVLDANGVVPEVADLALQISDDRTGERAQLLAWLCDRGIEPDDLTGRDDRSAPVAGLLSESQLRELDEVEGVELSQRFAQQTIRRHERALQIARAQQRDGVDPDAVGMAQALLLTPCDEVTAMQQYLATVTDMSPA